MYPNSLLTAPSWRFRNEVCAYYLLQHQGADVVPLVAVYSTEAHPFGLVYEYMDGLDVRQYLSNRPNVGRLKLVPTPIPAHSPYANVLTPLPTVDGNSSRLERYARPGNHPRNHPCGMSFLQPTYRCHTIHVRPCVSQISWSTMTALLALLGLATHPIF